MLTEKQSRVLELKIQEKELELAERKQRMENAEAQSQKLVLPVREAVVAGALERNALAEGLSSGTEPSEGYLKWLGTFREGGKVVVVFGTRGSGKSAFVFKLAEYLFATYGIEIYVLGMPEAARAQLPNWIHLADRPDQIPDGAFAICDEAGLSYLSLAFNTDRNKLLRAFLMICRHRRISLAFCCQSSRDAEYSICRQADTIAFKEPGQYQADSERPDLRKRARIATEMFQQMPIEERPSAAVIFDNCFQGTLKLSLPSFWSDELSHIYRTFDLSAMQLQVNRRHELQEEVKAETKLLNEASFDKQVLELRRQGLGIEATAKAIGCTTWKVRQSLQGIGRGNE
jgi:hypothetical protein